MYSRIITVLACAAPVAVNAYILGDETQLCWAAGALVGESVADCAAYAGIELQWVDAPPSEIWSETAYNVSCSITFSSTANISGGDTPVNHINIHSCDESISFCQPSVGSSLATHSPAKSGGIGTYVHELKLSPAGLWASICHGRIFEYTDQEGTKRKIDAAIAKLGIIVADKPVPPPDQTYIYIICGAIGGVAIIGAIAAVLIVRHIKNNRAVIKYELLKYNKNKVFKETGVSLIFLGTYMGTDVAIKQIKNKKQLDADEQSGRSSTNVLADKKTVNLGKASTNTLSLKSSKVSPSTGQATIQMDTGNMNQDGLKAIRTEIKLLNAIRHPNCVLFLGASYHNNAIYMVTEYMSHGALAEIIINPSIEMDMRTKASMASDVSNGINFLHSLQPALLHADIKSHNVFINSDLRAKIGDFGSTTVVTKQTRCGTPFWMAPDLLSGGCNTVATDIYALGMTYWELFAREELFPEYSDSTLTEVAQAIIGGQRPSLASRLIPDEIKGFIERAWHQSPDARPSAQECFDFFKNKIEDSEFLSKYDKKKDSTNEDLLYKILPPAIANQLRNNEQVKPIDCPEVTILFSDIVGFTSISSTLDPKDVMNMLNRLYEEFDKLTEKFELFKVETIGDAYMVAGGIFSGQDEQAEKIALMGLNMIRAADKVLISEENPELGTIKIRVGCHTGPIVASVVGKLNPRFCLFGDTVNFASRMESTSIKQRFQCTKATEKKLKAEAPHFVTEVRGIQTVKGKGKVTTYFIQSENPQAKTLEEEFPHDTIDS